MCVGNRANGNGNSLAEEGGSGGACGASGWRCWRLWLLCFQSDKRNKNKQILFNQNEFILTRVRGLKGKGSLIVKDHESAIDPGDIFSLFVFFRFAEEVGDCQTAGG